MTVFPFARKRSPQSPLPMGLSHVMLTNIKYLPATGAFSLPGLVAVACRSPVSQRFESKVRDFHSPGLDCATEISTELKTRALTSLVGCCWAAFAVASEIQDRTTRSIRFFICIPPSNGEKLRRCLVWVTGS